MVDHVREPIFARWLACCRSARWQQDGGNGPLTDNPRPCVLQFLALVLKKALADRLAKLGLVGSWPEIIADLDSLTETEVEQESKRFVIRTAPRPAASLAIA